MLARGSSLGNQPEGWSVYLRNQKVTEPYPISSVGRAPLLQRGGPRFGSVIGYVGVGKLRSEQLRPPLLHLASCGGMSADQTATFRRSRPGVRIPPIAQSSTAVQYLPV